MNARSVSLISGSYKTAASTGLKDSNNISVTSSRESPKFFKNLIKSMKLNRVDCSNKKVRRNSIIATVCILAIIAGLIGASLKRVSSIQYGVTYDVWKKILSSSHQTGGLYFGPIGYRFIKFPSTQINAATEDICISHDGLRVEYNVSYQYQLKPELLVDAINKYRDYETWTTIIHAAGNSAIQHSCSAWNITDFQSNRLAVQESMFQNVQIKLSGHGDDDWEMNAVENNSGNNGLHARAISLQLKNVELPGLYKNAVEEKQRAEEDILLARNERIQQIIIANTELLAAQQQGQRIEDQAFNDGNITITLANFQANRTMYRFEREIYILSQAQSFLNLNTNGVLSYMANKLFDKVSSLDVHMGEPVKVSRKLVLASQL